tara:strand:+ start:151 stop:387 length:237 start_codon:yes stop_codon:yes gene_type:complete
VIKALRRATLTLPILEEATVISFIVTVVTFGLRIIPSKAVVNPRLRDSKVRSIAVSLTPFYSTRIYNPRSASKAIKFS